MFQGLATDLEGFDPTAVSLQDLQLIARLRDQLEHAFCTAIGALDADDAYVADGATSMAAWLAHKTRTSGGDARRLTKTARKIRHLPSVDDAWRSGRLTSGHVAAIVANVKQRHLDAFAEQQREIVEGLERLSPADAAVVMQQWRHAADDALPGPEPDQRPNELYLSSTLEGRGEIRGSLDGDSTTIVETALKVCEIDDPEVPACERRGAALVAMAELALAHHDRPTTRRNRPHVTVVVREGADGEPCGTSLTGRPITTGRLEQWLCDGLLNRVMTADGHILDYGRSTPTVPVALWHAVAVRDKACRLDGCGRPLAWCEAHHVVPFDDGGDTSIANLALFCSVHHRLFHKGSGWQAKLDPHGRLDVTAPDGTVTTTYPPGFNPTLWPPGSDTG